MPVHHFLLSSGLQLSHGSNLWAWLRSWEPETVPSLIPCCLQGTARGMAHLRCEHQRCHPSHSVGCSCCFSAPCKTKLSLESSCPPRAPLDPALAQPALPNPPPSTVGYLVTQKLAKVSCFSCVKAGMPQTAFLQPQQGQAP